MLKCEAHTAVAGVLRPEQASVCAGRLEAVDKGP